MVHTCKCGGRMRCIDPNIPEYSTKYGRILYTTVRIKPGFATFQCDKCGKRAEQGLRLTKRG